MWPSRRPRKSRRRISRRVRGGAPPPDEAAQPGRKDHCAEAHEQDDHAVLDPAVPDPVHEGAPGAVGLVGGGVRGGPDAGRGGTFGRNTLIESIADLTMIYGNVLYHNPDNGFLPPGVPESFNVLVKELQALGISVTLGS